MVDFTKFLGANLDKVEKPKPYPVGTYSAMIQSHEMGASTNKQTPYIRFQVRLLAPLADVDPELLAEAGGMERLGKGTVDLTFFLTDNSMYRVKEFLSDTLGINISGRTTGECLPETTNMPLNVHIMHEPSKKTPGEVYSNIDSTSKA